MRGMAYETEVKISAIKISSHGRPDENDECFDRRNIGAIRYIAVMPDPFVRVTIIKGVVYETNYNS